MSWEVQTINGSTGNTDLALNALSSDSIVPGVENLSAGHFLATQQASPNRTVQVATGVIWVPNDSHTKINGEVGFYRALMNAVENSPQFATNVSGNPRIDVLSVKVDPGAVPGTKGSGSASLVITQGTPAVSPSIPATPSDCEPICYVTLPHNYASIITAYITDYRREMHIAKVAGPKGFISNYQISRTVASNNQTLSLLTQYGRTPSAYDPIFTRIGNFTRRITSALTLINNAGTNWANLGSAELGGLEHDLFLYIGWRAASGTPFLAWSRRPDYRVYGEFVNYNVSTDENYIATSGSTPATTDEVELIGRFNSILGLGGTYQWSAPASNVYENRPINETRDLVYNVNASASSGTYTSISYTERRYKISGNVLRLNLYLSGTNSTTPQSLRFNVPFKSKGTIAFGCRVNNSVGIAGWGALAAATLTGDIYKYDTSNLASGANIGFGFTTDYII